jgi:hypothetical protein
MSGMNDDPDFARLAAIGDPFADEASAPVRSADPPRLADGGADGAKAQGASPTRARVRATRRVAFVAALLFEVAFVTFDPHRRPLEEASPLELIVGLAIPLTAAAVAFMAATQRGPRGLGLPARAVALGTLVAPALFVVATLAGAPDAGSDPRFWRHAAGCASITAILALGPLALALWSFRRAFAAAATWRTAALGIAAGAFAAGAMSLACPITGALHVLLGHGAMMLVAALAGAWLAPVISRS